jgi:hypothetical protein
MHGGITRFSGGGVTQACDLGYENGSFRPEHNPACRAGSRSPGQRPDALNIFFSLEWWRVIGLVTLWLEGNFFVGAAKDLVD